MKRQKTARLSAKSFDDLARWVAEQRDELNRRMMLLLNRLADIGIFTAELNNTDPVYQDYIVFSKRQESNDSVLLVAMKTQDLTVYWTGGPPNGVEVNPLLMAEFGSGNVARDDKWTVTTHTGQGTFPGQTHANEPFWRFQPIYEDGTVGEWVTTSGTWPTMPVYSAWLEMTAQIMDVAREVFG